MLFPHVIIINNLKINVMKKNIRDYKKVGVQYAYILDAIDFEGSDLEKVDFFFYNFNEEYNSEYEKRRYPNLQVRIAEYLKGLPSCIGIAFSDYDIEQIVKSWGYCKTDKQAAKIVSDWWSVIASRLLQLKEYYNI